MRHFLDIASWSALALLVIGAAVTKSEPPPQPSPAPPPVEPVKPTPPPQPTTQELLAPYRKRIQELEAAAKQDEAHLEKLKAEVAVFKAKEKPPCNCKETGICTCCDCPDCPVHKPQKVAPNWHADITAARDAAERTGKPILIHFWTVGCAPCVLMDQRVFPDSGVRLVLDSFEAVSVDLLSLPKSHREHWGVRSVPADIVVTSDWKKYRRIASATDPAEYVQQLEIGLRWAAEKKQTRSIYQRVTQPVYFEPVYYQQPTHWGGGWGGGFSGGCGPGGCN